MDVHDIRYLHDELAPKDPEKYDFSESGSFIRKKGVLPILGLVFMVFITALLASVLTKPTSYKSSATDDAQTGTVVTPQPTVVTKQTRGKIVCSNAKTRTCEVGLQAADGKTYLLQNVQYRDVANGTLVPGSEVSISGITTGESGSQAIYVESVSSISTKPSSTPAQGVESFTAPSLTPTSKLTLTPTITRTPTPTLTPTPIPHFVDSTPQPGVSYVSIQYIRDNAQTLSGTQVNVGAFLVGGYIGSDGCNIFGICGYSIFYLADTNDPDRDIALDMPMKGNASEKEEDYTTGQNYYHKVAVVLSGGIVSLEKVY